MGSSSSLLRATLPRYHGDLMGSFRFVHAADLHIDSPLRGLEAIRERPAEQIRAATRRRFQRTWWTCAAGAAAFVLIAGDLFDGEWTDLATGLFLIRESAGLRRPASA